MYRFLQTAISSRGAEYVACRTIFVRGISHIFVNWAKPMKADDHISFSPYFYRYYTVIEAFYVILAAYISNQLYLLTENWSTSLGQLTELRTSSFFLIIPIRDTTKN